MEINVLIEPGFEDCLEAGWLQGVISQVLSVEQVVSEVELGLVITTQEKIKQLNRDYRDRDEVTDVLSFSMIPEAGQAGNEFPPFVTPPDGVLHLGEVIISYPQTILQAKEQHHSTKKELTVLIIHGVLHLLGYDHEEPEPEHRMKAREKEILARIEGELG